MRFSVSTESMITGGTLYSNDNYLLLGKDVNMVHGVVSVLYAYQFNGV